MMDKIKTIFLNLDNNSRVLLILIIVISVLLVAIFLFNFFSNRKERRINKIIKNKNKKLKKVIEKESRNVEIPESKKKSEPTIKKEASIVASTISVKEEPKIETKEEIEELVEYEEVEVIQDEKESDIDRLISEVKDVNNNMFDLTDFEREQEETAIISYEELCKKAGVEKKIYKAEPTKPVYKVEEPKGKYRPSKVISPIYGVQDDSRDDLDQTFLRSLKEFRNGLE